MLGFLNKKEKENHSDRWIPFCSQIKELNKHILVKENEFLDISYLEPLFKDRGLVDRLDFSKIKEDPTELMGLCHVLACFSSQAIDRFFKNQNKVLKKLKVKGSPLASSLLKKATSVAFYFRHEEDENGWYDRFLTQFNRLSPTFDLRNTLEMNRKTVTEQNSTISILCKENHIPELKLIFSHGCSAGLEKTKNKFFDDDIFHHFAKNNYPNHINSVECFDLLLKNGFNVESWNQKLKEVSGSHDDGFSIKNLAHLIKGDWDLARQLIEEHQSFYKLSKEQMQQWHLNTLMDSNVFDYFYNINPSKTKLTDGYIRFLNQEYPDVVDWMVPTNYKINKALPKPKNIISVADYLLLANKEALLTELLIHKNLNNKALPVKNSSPRF